MNLVSKGTATTQIFASKITVLMIFAQTFTPDLDHFDKKSTRCIPFRSIEIARINPKLLSNHDSNVCKEKFT